MVAVVMHQVVVGRFVPTALTPWEQVVFVDFLAVGEIVHDTERAVGRYIPPSGLGIISVLCRMWGNAPTPTGKTVWAVLGPENRL